MSSLQIQMLFFFTISSAVFTTIASGEVVFIDQVGAGNIALIRQSDSDIGGSTRDRLVIAAGIVQSDPLPGQMESSGGLLGLVSQSGDLHFIAVRQLGRGSQVGTVDAIQDGAAHRLSILQINTEIYSATGQAFNGNNSIEMWQRGDGSSAAIYQRGLDNIVVGTQFGAANSVDIVQGYLQPSNFNFASTRQMGTGHSMTIRQD